MSHESSLPLARERSSAGLFVLGMHRSGTSATAGALQRLGFALGEGLIEGAADNPKGYFELAAAVAANEDLLDALDRSWDDVRALPRDWMRSEAARAVLPAIDAVLDGLSGGARWALKDPRLCRMLPLWLEAAAERGAETRCLLVLRHPAEVAASLRARDDISPETAAILWLRHVLESLRASAMRPRTLLTYDALMRDPQRALGDACARLGFDIGGIGAADLRAFVDLRDRHHRLDADRSADPGESSASPFMALALAMYRAAADGGDAAIAADDFEAEFERLAGREALWIEALGRSLRAADVRRRRLQAHALAAQSRAETLQTLFEDASALSLQRLDALQSQDAALNATQVALEAAKALSLERLTLLREQDLRLGDTQAALQAAEVLSLERLALLREQDLRLGDTQAALEAAEALSLERLALLGEQDMQLGRTQAALEATEAQSLQRLAESQALRSQLDATESALALAERLSLERQHELHTLHSRLAQTETALAAVDTLSRGRLAEMERLQAEIERVQAAVAGFERIAIQRLAAMETLEAGIAGRDDEIARLRVRESQLLALERSRWFRMRRLVHRWFGLERPERT